MLTRQDLSKGFPGVRVLHGVSLDLEPGKVYALAGERWCRAPSDGPDDARSAIRSAADNSC